MTTTEKMSEIKVLMLEVVLPNGTSWKAFLALPRFVASCNTVATIGPFAPQDPRCTDTDL